VIPSLEELRKRLIPAVGPDSAPNPLFKRKPRLSTTPTPPNLPLSSDSPAPQHLRAPASDHSSAQTAPLGDGSAVEQPGAEIDLGSAHSDDQIVQDLAGGNSPQRGLFHFQRPAAENPTKQRRYFVKEGVFVDHEDENPITSAGEAVKGISDRLPVNLKTLFPKLSLR
jgi:hypothetical protein